MATALFKIVLKYRCQQCGLSSPQLKVSPPGEICRGTIPTACVKCGQFEVATVSMSQKETLIQLTRLETALADRLYKIDQKILETQAKKQKLIDALRRMHPHPQIKAGIHTLNKSIVKLEDDKIRHRSLMSEDLVVCKTHLSRLREDGLEERDDRRCTKCKIPFVPLWPLPWQSERKKIDQFPCPKCKGKICEEVMGL